MDNTTDTLTRPETGSVGLLPPPVTPDAPYAAPSVTPWPGQISQAGPSLPGFTAPAPRPTSSDGNQFATMMYSPPPRARAASRSTGGLRRAVSWILLLAALGGIGFAGMTYGPELVESFGADATNEPSAALVYPMVATPPPTVRTASFTVSELDSSGRVRDYEVTADFETGITRIVIVRTDSPNIEILTLWDQAFIRRIDEPTWYRLPRGDFPIDFSLGRSRWVHTIDELIPQTIRGYATIDEATESTVGTVPTRRLVVSFDAARLLQAQMAAESTPVEGAPPAPPSPLPPGMQVRYGLNGVETLTMEIWVDGDGVVRKSVLPPELGGETVTVTSMSPDAWEPMFPTAAETQPLTAEVLFRLGL